MKQTPQLLLFVFALLSASCTTTGDPSKGGLFGWSESKTISKTSALQEKKNAIEAQLASLNMSKNQKQAQLNELRNSLARVNAQIQSSSPQSSNYDKLIAQRDKIQKDIEAYSASQLSDKMSLPPIL